MRRAVMFLAATAVLATANLSAQATSFAGTWTPVVDPNAAAPQGRGGGAAGPMTISQDAKTMTITSDGQPVKTLQVSLGAAKTPTYLGTALVMAKSNPEEMKSDPGEVPGYDVMVPWSVRITDSGEFIHDASWNGQIGSANTSHGCTNLSPADAQWYYNWAQIGDPVTYANTGTSTVIPAGDGWGDWNVDWNTWTQGGLLPPGQ